MQFDTATVLFLGLLVHLIGDYLLQSDWMAQQKTSKNLPALAHALTYTLCFTLLTQNDEALAIIGGTHFLIDRYRLARYMCWAKNLLLSPNWTYWCSFCKHSKGGCCGSCEKVATKPWSECKATGYDPDRPLWLTVWLLIIADNTLHICINSAVLMYLR